MKVSRELYSVCSVLSPSIGMGSFFPSSLY